MPDVADWRNPSNYEPDDALDWPSIAMGYLARNKAYRADHAEAVRKIGAGAAPAMLTEQLIKRWGITLPVKVMGRCDLRDVIVPPDRCPGALVLVAASESASSMTGHLFGPTSVQMCEPLSDGGEYVVLHAPNGDHRLWFSAGLVDPQALRLPLDDRLGMRIAAAHRLYRHLRGLPVPPSPLQLTELQLARHLRLFRLLDGRAVGARPKLLACVLIDRAVVGFGAAEWADSRERKQIGRWTAQAEWLRDGGYAELIAGR